MTIKKLVVWFILETTWSAFCFGNITILWIQSKTLSTVISIIKTLITRSILSWDALQHEFRSEITFLCMCFLWVHGEFFLHANIMIDLTWQYVVVCVNIKWMSIFSRENSNFACPMFQSGTKSIHHPSILFISCVNSAVGKLVHCSSTLLWTLFTNVIYTTT